MPDIGNISNSSNIGWADWYLSRNGAGRGQINSTLEAATGNEVALTLDYTVNKAAGNDTGLLINMTDTSSPGTSYLLDAQVGGASKFSVSSAATITAGLFTLTPGASVVSTFAVNGTDNFAITNAETRFLLGIGLSSAAGAASDVKFYRNSAGNLGLHGIGANAALFVYSDDTTVGANPTNYEALKLTCDTSCNGYVDVAGNGLSTPNTLYLMTNGSSRLAIGSTNSTLSTNLTFADAKDIVVNTTTGSKIGTATSQKLGFWNATPVIQPTTGVAEATFVENGGGTVVNVDSTFGGYTLQQVVQALQTIGLLA